MRLSRWWLPNVPKRITLLGSCAKDSKTLDNFVVVARDCQIKDVDYLDSFFKMKVMQFSL